MDLDNKTEKPAPAEQPKYRAHPTNKSIRINIETGKWETLPPSDFFWPFPASKP